MSFTASITKLKTARLILWELTPHVVQKLFGEHSDKEVMEILQMTSEADYENIKDKFYNRSIHNERLSYHNFLIYDQPDGPPIGDCCYHIIWRRHKRAEIGYTLWHDTAKRKGYMTEALETILRKGLGDLGFTRIEAFTSDENIPSMRLLHRFGFARESVVPNHYIINEGEPADKSLSWGLIPENFQNDRPEEDHAFLVQQFERHSLPITQWDHKAHLIVGLCYLHQFGFEGALCKMRSGIITYNAAMGKKNSLEEGYHETATIFWMKMLDRFKKQHADKTLNDQIALLADHPISKPSFINEYYSEEVINSITARGRWVGEDVVM